MAYEKSEATLKRDKARKRLIRFLRRGGHLVNDFLPGGKVAWASASRSGYVFDDAMVQRLIKKGWTDLGAYRNLKWDTDTNTWIGVDVPRSKP